MLHFSIEKAMRHFKWWVLPLFFVVAIGCRPQEPVVRKRGPVLEQGRAIPGAAYSWYVRALVAERREKAEEALLSYRRALGHDPKSAAAYAGLIRVGCRLRGFELQKTVELAVHNADRPAIVWATTAECLLSQQQPELALDFAQQALAREPFLQLANQAVAGALEQTGRAAQAARYRRAFRLATGAVLERSRAPEDASLAAIDRALWEGDLPTARSRAASVISPGALSARALGWGRRALAEDQAQLVFDADPSDPDAALVLHLLGREPHFTSRDRPLSLVALLLLAHEIERKVGERAARAALRDRQPAIVSSSDRLVRDLGALFLQSAEERNSAAF